MNVVAGFSVRLGGLLAESPGEYAFYRFGNLAINVWTGAPTGAAVRKLEELTVVSRTACPQGISSVHWVARGIGLPTSEARAGFSEIALRHGDHIAGVGVILDGEGFWASALRSALSGILLIGPKAPFPLRIHGTPEELAAWLPAEHVAKTKTPLERDVLLTHIAAVRPK